MLTEFPTGIQLIPIQNPMREDNQDHEGFNPCHPPAVNVSGIATNISLTSKTFDINIEQYVGLLKEAKISFSASFGSKYANLTKPPLPSAHGAVVTISATVLDSLPVSTLR